MKTLKFKLFTTILALAAVTYISILPANAQRRSTESEQTTRNAKPEKEVRKAVEKKSTFINTDKVDRNNTNRKSTSQRSSAVSGKRQANSNSTRQSRDTQSNQRKSNFEKSERIPTKSSVGRNSSAQQNQRPVFSEQNNNRNKNNNTNSGIRSGRSEVPPRNRETATRVDTNTPDGRRNTGRTVNDNRNFYRTDKNDHRYSTSNDYRGRKDYWSERNRPGNMNYNRNDHNHYSNYTFNNYRYWDRSWETYRWNYNSWRDYYSGYNPYSFVYYKNYYHHPRFGHVIRSFDFRPVVFLHNHLRYYCFDGHFFRYRPGVGYILVDLPFGFTFDLLPAGYYERAYINGYLYFRVGNLFFESTAFGFSLVHFPERYYAWDGSYQRQGYLFDDDYY